MIAGQTPFRKIIFGGSFSPPTLAHEAIIRMCLAMPGFAEVWVMPSGDRRDKTMSAGDADRLAMLAIVKHASFHDDPRFIITEFELRLPRPTATYQTAAALNRAYPNTEFWFVLGTDSYDSMVTDAWEHGAALRSTLHMIIVGRDDSVADTGRLRHLPLHIPAGISSTAVRVKARAGEPLDGMVSPPVATYISGHRLYR